MSESGSSKTEQPTPKKKRKAREEGQFAKSKELASFGAIIGMVCLFTWGYPNILDIIYSNYDAIWNVIYHQQFKLEYIGLVTNQLLLNLLILVLIPVGIASTISLLVNIAQSGGIIIKKEAFKIDVNKLNPASQAKQIFGLKSLIKFAINIVQITVMVIVGIIVIRMFVPDIFYMANYGLSKITWFMGIVFVKLLFTLLGIYLMFACIDFVREKMSLHKQLMMTKEEVEREMKETDGDPELKHRRKELHRELLMDDNFTLNSQKASMVLANPTHYAVVILYSPRRWIIPVIMLKAKGAEAKIIFKAARDANIPIIHDIWLTRTLYKIGIPGKFVPKSMQPHIATIIEKNLNLMPQILSEILYIKNLSTAKAAKKNMEGATHASQ